MLVYFFLMQSQEHISNKYFWTDLSIVHHSYVECHTGTRRSAGVRSACACTVLAEWVRAHVERLGRRALRGGRARLHVGEVLGSAPSWGALGAPELASQGVEDALIQRRGNRG